MVRKFSDLVTDEERERILAAEANREASKRVQPSRTKKEKTARQLDIEKKKAEAVAEEKRAAKERKAGKSIAVATRDSEDSSNGEGQAPLKKAKKSMTKGKGIDVGRDRKKEPSKEELYDHLIGGITWVPTRFPDKPTMKELGIYSAVKELMSNMGLKSFLSMAYPTYEEVSSQFLATLEATFYYDEEHDDDGWGKISFTINGNTHHMGFKEIGRVLGIKDDADPELPPYKSIPKNVWEAITGRNHITGADKNTAIRHPALRYTHRAIVHTLFPRKEPGSVNEDDLKLLGNAIRPFMRPANLPMPNDTYSDLGLVGLLVRRFMYYQEWAWTNKDKEPQLGIGGLITPLLIARKVDLGKSKGPHFLDMSYLRIALVLTGMYEEKYVYSYLLKDDKVEILLPNEGLTKLEEEEDISFYLPYDAFLGPHGPLDPIVFPKKKGKGKGKAAQEAPDSQPPSPIYGPPRYYFEQHTGALPRGALRDAHEHIGKLQGWNKSQDRVIFKLKEKLKKTRKAMKKQAEATTHFMKKVANILVKGGVAGCSAADFVMKDTSNPQPQRSAMGFPLTELQKRRQKRNPPAPRSASGNNSPSLASSDNECEIEEVESGPYMGNLNYTNQGYYTTCPDDYDEEASASHHHP